MRIQGHRSQAVHPVLAEASMELHIRGLGDILPSAVIRSKTKMLLCPYFFFPAKFCPYPSGRIFPQLVPDVVLMDTMPQTPVPHTFLRHRLQGVASHRQVGYTGEGPPSWQGYRGKSVLLESTLMTLYTDSLVL